MNDDCGHWPVRFCCSPSCWFLAWRARPRRAGPPRPVGATLPVLISGRRARRGLHGALWTTLWPFLQGAPGCGAAGCRSRCTLYRARVQSGKSTVKTHVKHVYEKCAVLSHQDLSTWSRCFAEKCAEREVPVLTACRICRAGCCVVRGVMRLRPGRCATMGSGGVPIPLHENFSGRSKFFALDVLFFCPIN